MSKQRITEAEFEDLISNAVIDNFYEELNSVPSREKLVGTYTTTSAYQNRIKKLIKRDEQKEKVYRVLKNSKRFVAVLFIFAIICFGTMMFNSTVRAIIVNTIISWHDKFVRFTFINVERVTGRKEPTFLPDGFWEEQRIELDQTTILLFMNEAGESIIFESVPANAQVSVDGTQITYEVVIEQNTEFHIFRTTDDFEIIILWEKEGWSYKLYSTISIEYLMQMAHSIG